MVFEWAQALVGTAAAYCGWKAATVNFLMYQKYRGIPDYHEMTVTMGGGLDKKGRQIDGTRTNMLRQIWLIRACKLGAIVVIAQLVTLV